jgi:hypothetical protein
VNGNNTPSAVISRIQYRRLCRITTCPTRLGLLGGADFGIGATDGQQLTENICIPPGGIGSIAVRLRGQRHVDCLAFWASREAMSTFSFNDLSEAHKARSTSSVCSASMLSEK